MSKHFCCEYCEYKSNRLYNLQRHTASHHKNVTQPPNSDTQQDGQKVHVGGQKVHVDGQKVHFDGQKVHVDGQKVHVDCEKVNLLLGHLQCEKCYKEFSNERSLKRHEIICKETISPNQCPKCLKILASKQSKCNHMKICKETRRDIIPSINNVATENHVNSHNTVNSHNQNNHCLINNGTVNNNNNITINIRNFGDENLDHITNEVKDRLIHQLNGKGIVKLIKDVHFNPSIPENHNVRKFDNSLWKVFDNGDWEIRSYKSTIHDLIKRHKDLLCERIADPEFEKIVNDPTTMQLIMLNYINFSMDKVPAHYWKCVRDIYAAFINFERKQDMCDTLDTVQ